MNEISQKELKERLRYDAETGNFYWAKVLPRSSSRVGDIAGCIENKNGYRVIKINRRMYKAHRLAWLYVHGQWPNEVLDHVNGDPSDNRICNLREATHSQNMWNSRTPKNSSSGMKGASWCTTNKAWISSIKKNRKTYHLGHFATADEAAAAYRRAALELHGDFARFE